MRTTSQNSLESESLVDHSAEDGLWRSTLAPGPCPSEHTRPRPVFMLGFLDLHLPSQLRCGGWGFSLSSRTLEAVHIRCCLLTATFRVGILGGRAQALLLGNGRHSYRPRSCTATLSAYGTACSGNRSDLVQSRSSTDARTANGIGVN